MILNSEGSAPNIPSQINRFPTEFSKLFLFFEIQSVLLDSLSDILPLTFQNCDVSGTSPDSAESPPHSAVLPGYDPEVMDCRSCMEGG